ncbi:MAG TPA: tetratricopeptide repeat protein [Burkholderiales bacterium]|nr:tetratricopeptide repeat protein [Burkholderiales bacterium]
MQGRLAQAEGRAAAQLRSGDAAAAARSYDEALRIATALEDLDAVAVNAINLSIVYQWLGRNAEARAALAAVVDDPRPFPARRRLQAELRRAIVDLAAGEPASAAAMAARAERRCAPRCDYSATLLNVNAEIALARGDASGAAGDAARALERARSGEDSVEAANALRTLGRSARLRGDPAGARTLLEQALELDRKLADPRKILADLTELAGAAQEQGDRAAASGYAARAAAVGRVVDSGRGMAEMEAGLRRP